MEWVARMALERRGVVLKIYSQVQQRNDHRTGEACHHVFLRSAAPVASRTAGVVELYASLQ